MKKSKRTSKRFFSNDANVISLTSIVITVLGILWNVMFGYGKMSGRLDALEKDMGELKVSLIRFEDKMENWFEKMDQRFDRLENRMDNAQSDLHKVDLRVNTLETRKP